MLRFVAVPDRCLRSDCIRKEQKLTLLLLVFYDSLFAWHLILKKIHRQVTADTDIHQFQRSENGDIFCFEEGIVLVIFSLDTTVSMSTTPGIK
jgi:hypothetical protein